MLDSAFESAFQVISEKTFRPLNRLLTTFGGPDVNLHRKEVNNNPSQPLIFGLIMTVRTQPILVFIWCLLASHSVFAKVPNIFTPGAMARAEQVNENFTALDQRLAVLEPDRYSIDCSNDPQALQVHWDNTGANSSHHVEYTISGTCNFDYDDGGARALTIRGGGPAVSKIIGSLYQSGSNNYLGLFDIGMGASSNEIFNGEVIRPSGGTMLELIGVQLNTDTSISAWDAFTRVNIERSTILSPVNLHSGQLNVQHSQLTNLGASASRVYFHDGGLTGTLQLNHSHAQFQRIGAPDGDSYIPGEGFIQQSDMFLSSRIAGNFNVTHGSRLILADGATVEGLYLMGSQLSLYDASVVSDQITLDVSTVFAAGDTAVNYVCDTESRVVGDLNNATAQACR